MIDSIATQVAANPLSKSRSPCGNLQGDAIQIPRKGWLDVRTHSQGLRPPIRAGVEGAGGVRVVVGAIGLDLAITGAGQSARVGRHIAGAGGGSNHGDEPAQR